MKKGEEKKKKEEKPNWMKTEETRQAVDGRGGTVEVHSHSLKATCDWLNI